MNEVLHITDSDLPANLTGDPDADRLVVRRPPEHVLAEAQEAARALKRVIDAKLKPVKFNGETYLEFPDWQICGRFYGVTAKVVSTEFVDYGAVQGFAARAEALRSDGQAVSAAEAMCLNDEENWSTRAKYEYRDGKRVQVGTTPVPLFQLRSMAQTRACAKALRNVLSWVVVLAGYRATPAEEMDGFPSRQEPPANAEPPASSSAPRADEPRKISAAQAKRLYAIARGSGATAEDLKSYLFGAYGVQHSADILPSDYDAICAHYGALNERR